MTYKVFRTSLWGGGEQPLAEAWLDEKSKCWLVEVDDLLEFVDEHGQIVLSIDEFDGKPTIEIYDAFRE